ncbi:uncharacterized protein LOC107479409 [Arachis duranensis]|uniref:Uncharacterized protein LOC107479409 n=1 Tax=Arachis duranensis TaxID=130453 RepID=A0A6P4CQG5_ARADU|nr:uncharacterized protein LOC107479409 [Arachis duranensis]
MNFELPRRFILLLTLTPYDGLGDPKRFLEKFRSIMIVNGASDTVFCHCFPNYLDGPALDWLCTLPGQNESLKDYMTHFTKVAISIPDLHPEVHLHALKSGLRPGKSKKPSRLPNRKPLPGQIDIEELTQAWKSDKTYYRDEDKFNTKREDIIKEILNLKLIKPPRKAGTYQDTKNVDKSKYCAFHQKHGHTTDKCVVAKELLEWLARQGHLDKYIGGHIQRRTTPSTANTSSEQQNRGKEKASSSQYEQHRGIINCISRGYTSGGSPNSAKKQSFRAIYSVDRPQHEPQIAAQFLQMTFTHGDFDSNIQNLNDPVVITLQLGDSLVRKDEHVVTIHGDHKEARQCYNISMRPPSRSKQLQVNNVHLSANSSTLADLDPRADFLERPMPTGTTISTVEQNVIKAFLQEQADLFAWTPSDMPGIDP